MTAEEYKQKIIGIIDRVEDQVFLRKIYIFINSAYSQYKKQNEKGTSN